jgi:hypothetical protein
VLSCLIYEAGDEQPYLHEHEVCCWVEVGEAVEGEVVVEAVEGGGDEVQHQHPPVIAHASNQGTNTVPGKT